MDLVKNEISLAIKQYGTRINPKKMILVRKEIIRKANKLDKKVYRLDKMANRLDKKIYRLDKMANRLDKKVYRLDKMANRLDKKRGL